MDQLNCTIATNNNAGLSAVGWSSWIILHNTWLPVNRFAIHIGYYIEYTIYRHCSFRGNVRIQFVPT